MFLNIIGLFYSIFILFAVYFIFPYNCAYGAKKN